MDTAQWPQEIMLKPVEEMIEPNKCLKPGLERKVRPQREQALNCPRCNSTNTKFCYYNNYSLSQPRYFCKTCRRYWTEGGSLRNIPVGGGSRKNKRSSSSSSSKKVPDQLVPPTSSASQNPKTTHEGQDLNLGFLSHDFKAISDLIQVPNLELLNGISSRGLMSSLMPLPSNSDNPSAIFSSGFSLQELNKTNLNFSPDGYEGLNQNFPFEDLKQISSTSEVEQCKGQGDSTGYWNGVLGGGSW
ncbi:hypothetical protein NMG60_11026904 [Bertholletia excelsa]